MAARPWIAPQEVRDYTIHKAVKAREDWRLRTDITRAESYIISRTRNDFSDLTKFPAIPENVKIATLLLAELHALNATSAGSSGLFRSESFDDYSYTKAEADSWWSNLSLGELLDEYICAEPSGNKFMRMRKI